MFHVPTTRIRLRSLRSSVLFQCDLTIDRPFAQCQLMESRGHEQYMQLAIAEAQAAVEVDEVPVGAIIVRDGDVIGAAHNQRETLQDPTAHAEMIAITQAAQAMQSWRLEGCTLYVTLEPCTMCAGAIVQARIPVLVFGARDPKAGACVSLYSIVTDPRLNHRVQIVGGIRETECARMLQDFFGEKRRPGGGRLSEL